MSATNITSVTKSALTRLALTTVRATLGSNLTLGPLLTLRNPDIVEVIVFLYSLPSCIIGQSEASITVEYKVILDDEQFIFKQQQRKQTYG